ncbi:PH domain-containing protein [Aquipuribacter hungaricus]|uniref:PH domain-containing protein n=1 Tax=Aquipuribacter hungaricus TaxID=545624 RepID=A0ABV7WKL7_9MICO
MTGGTGPVLRWHQPHPSTRRVLALGTAGAALLSLAVVSLVVGNYDAGVLAGVLGLAAVVDLWAEMRPRGFVLAGDDGLVVRTGSRPRVLPWGVVAAVRVQPRRLGRDRPVVELVDGSVVPLPRDVPLEELQARRPGSGTTDQPGAGPADGPSDGPAGPTG